MQNCCVSNPLCECPIAASLGLQCVLMTCVTSPTSSLGDSKNRSLQIPHGHQFLMNVCLSPGMCPCLSGSFKFPEVVQLAPMITSILGFPVGTSGKEPACQCRRHKRHGFDPWVWKIPWRSMPGGAWQPTPVVLSGESHGQRRAAVHRATKSQTQLKQLSTHTMSILSAAHQGLPCWQIQMPTQQKGL